ncbi:MAG: phosphatidylserine decarboxylase family protein [Paludibacteraceae bacterium]|nr:phosphatidylserine decarboxylase family protein [Paludibacteraceae bacterium]
MRARIHREGRNAIIGIVLLLFLINVPVFIMFGYHWIFAVTLVLMATLLVFVTYFFRNPVRVIEVDDPDFVVAPADGRVVVVERVREEEYFHEERLQVSIFMSPFNVHANWYPIEGKVIVSEHQKGRHRGAWLPKSSTENERSLVVIETESNVRIAVRQVAGAMARRIVTYAKAGGKALRNSHLGFIKLGSRVDLYLPLNTEMFVEVGDAVRGNETILGRINAPEEVSFDTQNQ